MPIFEYKCNECQKTVDVIERFVDSKERECPSCKGTMQKQIGAPSFRLKGDGWYKKTSKVD